MLNKFNLKHNIKTILGDKCIKDLSNEEFAVLMADIMEVSLKAFEQHLKDELKRQF